MVKSDKITVMPLSDYSETINTDSELTDTVMTFQEVYLCA